MPRCYSTLPSNSFIKSFWGQITSPWEFPGGLVKNHLLMPGRKLNPLARGTKILHASALQQRSRAAKKKKKKVIAFSQK